MGLFLRGIVISSRLTSYRELKYNLLYVVVWLLILPATGIFADYQAMAQTYLDFYIAAKTTKGTLPYIAPASPGWDSRPWNGASAVVRENPTPEKFKQMLLGAKQLIDSNKTGIPNIIMIEAWNEFGEGAYIEPTKKWGFEYLKTIRDVFGKSPH